jgi:hypothetical protein
MVAGGAIDDRSGAVLQAELDFWNLLPDSFYCAHETIARRVGFSALTVKRRRDWLVALGIQARVKVATFGRPDPNDPRNRTGERWVIVDPELRRCMGLKNAPVADLETVADRQPLTARRKSPLAQELTERVRVSKRPPVRVSNRYPNLRVKPDIKQTTTGNAHASCDSWSEPRSSSSGSSSREKIAAAVDQVLLAALTLQAAKIFGHLSTSADYWRGKILALFNYWPRRARKAGLAFTLQWVAIVFASAEKRNRTVGKFRVKDWGYVVSGLENLCREGGPAPPPPPKKPDVIVGRPIVNAQAAELGAHMNVGETSRSAAAPRRLPPNQPPDWCRRDARRQFLERFQAEAQSPTVDEERH